MIIHDIRYGKELLGLFGRTHLIVETSDGTGKIPIRWHDEPTLSILTKHAKNFTLQTADDLHLLHTLLADLPPTYYRDFELALLNATPRPWQLFGKHANQLPRPLTVIAQKNDGTQFLLLALEARSIVHTLLAFEDVSNDLQQRLGRAEERNGVLAVQHDTDSFLHHLEQAIRTTHSRHGIAIQKGIAFPANSDQATCTRLIKHHHLVYLENPFPLSHAADYEALTTTYQDRCFITTSSADLYQHHKTNAVLLTYQDALHTKHLIDQFLTHEQKNIFLHGSEGLVSIASSLSIPVLKFILRDRTGKALTNEYLALHHTIRKNTRPKDL